MPEGSILITNKVIIAILITQWTNSMQCSSAVAYLQEYACNDQEFFGKGASGEAFLVHKDDKKYILKAQKVTEPDDRAQALTDLKYLMLFRGLPYLAQLVESKQTPEYLFEVLEFGENGNLENFYERRKDLFENWRSILEFFLKILKGVAIMHSKKVVHADIKFANIVINKDVDPILIDFDLSVQADTENYGRGTAEYMDPVIMEAWGRKKTVYNQFRDIYSLGVTLYYLSQNRYPFAGGSRHEVFDNIKSNKYTLNQGTHIEIAKIIHSCLRLKENDRKTLQEIIDMTKSALEQNSNIFLSTELTVSNNEPLVLLSRELTTPDGLAMMISMSDFFVFLIGLILLLAGIAFAGLKYGMFGKTKDENESHQQTDLDQISQRLDQQA